MKKYVDFLQKFRWFIAIGVPLIVLALASNLKQVEMDGSYRIWFGEDSKTLTDYDKFRKTFGNDDGIVIVFQDKEGIFTKKALESIDNITEALWKTKYIARVDSLTNYQYVHGSDEDPDDIIVENFIKNIEHATPAYLAERKKIATSDPLVLDSFISKDGTTTMISARLTPKVNDGSDKSLEIMDYVDAILAPEIERTGYKYWINGGPALNKAFTVIGTNDAMTFTPLVLIASALLLFFLFRRVSGALIPLGIVILTFITVLSVQVLLGYKLNNFTANLPVFVVAIGIADAVHVYTVWLLHRREGDKTELAVLKSVEKNFLPILLTSITTAIGFATLTISEVIPIFTLGIATASGAILAFIISVLWMPTVLLLLKKPIQQQSVEVKTNSWGIGYGKFIVENNKKIVWSSLTVFSFLALGIMHVKVDSNTIRYFDKEVEIRKTAEFTMAHLTGPMAYEIVVDSGQQHGIKEPEFMKTVERFYTEFHEAFPEVRHLASLMDTVKRFNKVVDNKEVIPDSRELIAQYLLLYSLSLPQGMEINDKMDIDERKLRVTGQMDIVDTSKDLEMIAYIENWWKKTAYSATVEGQTYMFAHMQKDVTNTLIYSLSLAIVLVSFVMMLIFRRLKLIWVFILPNILPVILVVGLMGWIDITIDIGVAIAGAIIIGVAVDDTIHFLVKYFDARKRGLSMEDTFDEVLKYAGKAILFTTIILSVAFSLFAFSEFSPNQNFGIVTAFALLIAFVVDLLLLPALLSLADKEGK
ncbi:MAG: Predicted exporter of the RND superfamily [uncultured Sulfurovum sp.]|uniref:Predicted exporter of the RND superfamily n=1 Tax=uncultured Sulfurovum sp. TaxID=269237 RepID=A0A6S6T7Y7_9BACT|nr:MAG: Predicted exporter of the RND superfamily [uncultured Sulfurovum sp.]